MPKIGLDSRKTRTLTMTALLGLFVGAAVVALAARLVPGGRSKVVRRLLGRGEDDGDAPRG
jgi:hypothetical protein